MSPQASISVLALLAALTAAQSGGEYTAEVHPKLPSQRCTLRGGCVTANTSVVLDSQYRWTHNINGYNPCKPDAFDPTYCPDVESCGKNCVVEGVDYGSYGIHTNGSALTLNLFVTSGNTTSMSSPRVYLFDESTGKYDAMKLLNQEFTFDVDVTKVPCGVNGALYFSEMSADGDASDINTAGAAYGTGYCDAQCPTQNFVNGEANLNMTYGACCNEMDIWEANNNANAFTPHPCNITGSYACEEPLCGDANRYAGVCDKDGCDFNTYRNGVHNFYGWGKNHTVDTSRVFTIVTQFVASGTGANQTLSQIRRLYVQDGRVINNAAVNVTGIPRTNAISDSYCAVQKEVMGGENAFAAQGGLKGIGGALGRGMVLAMSIWDDSGSYMGWLDTTYPTDADPSSPGVARGSCPTSSGRPADIIAQYPDAAVTFSNIKVGDIGSTYGVRRH